MDNGLRRVPVWHTPMPAPPPPARKTRWRLQRPNTQWWPAARIPRALSCGGARGPAALNGHLDRVMDFFPRTSSFALFCATLYVNGPPPGQSSLSSAVIQEVRQDARAASVAHASTTAACLGQSLAVKACMELGGGGVSSMQTQDVGSHALTRGCGGGPTRRDCAPLLSCAHPASAAEAHACAGHPNRRCCRAARAAPAHLT